jgi:trk system potassium uptake protein TrkA
MYIMVIGGGQVGYYLTRALLNEGHEVLLIEKRKELCDIVNNEMGSICLCGDGCETTTLDSAGTARADMFIAVTGDDEDNLVACQVAKHRFKVPRILARVRNPKNETIFRKLGIDTAISSTSLILEHIEREVPTHPLTHLLSIREKGLEIVDIKIPEGSINVGKALKELSLPPDSILALIIRKERKPTAASANTILQSEDQVIAVIPPESEDALRAALTGE